MLSKEDFRLKLNGLLHANPKTVRVMRGATDIHSLNIDNVMEGGRQEFPNGDPGLFTHIAACLRTGKEVAISAAGPDKLLVFAAVGLFRK